jgi:hypothetical protein
MWAIIRVNMDYDYCMGIDCLKVFSTDEECQQFIDKRREDELTRWKEREAHIDRFIETIVVPENIPGNRDAYQKCEAFKEEWGIPNYTQYSDSLKAIKSCLRQSYGIKEEKIKACNAPVYGADSQNLHYVEIPEVQ